MNPTLLNQQGRNSESEDMDLSNLFNYILANKWFIIAITALCFGLGMIYSKMKPKFYQADTYVELKIRDKKNILDRVNMIFESQRMLIKSVPILLPVVQSLGLPNAMADKIRNQLQTTETLNESNNVLINIAYKDTDPALIVNILNGIGTSLQQYNIQQKSQRIAHKLKESNAALHLAEQSLSQAESALIHYHGDHKISANNQSLPLNNPNNPVHHETSDALQNQAQQIEHQLNAVPEMTLAQVSFIKDIEAKTKVYETLLRETQRLEVEKNHLISDYTVLSKAVLPTAPLPNHNKFIHVFSILSGLMLSLFVIFGRKILFPKIDHPLWSEKHLNIINLSVIPFSLHQRSIQKTSTPKSALPLLAKLHSKDLSIESLRHLRTHLQLNLAYAKNNVVSLLSATSGVGKTFIASNLAYLLALTGKKVLLLDANFRNGNLHTLFHLSAYPGCSDIIQNKLSFEAALHNPIDHLFILTKGSDTSHPAELLESQSFKNLIQSCAQQFDIILIDNAPLLSITDGMLTASISAINYLVIGFNAHQPQTVEMTVKSLSQAGIAINGSIFNFNKPSRQQSTYIEKIPGNDSKELIIH